MFRNKKYSKEVKQKQKKEAAKEVKKKNKEKLLPSFVYYMGIGSIVVNT